MQVEFRKQDDLFFHVETGQCAGRIIPLKDGKGFSVHRTMTLSSNERDKIGIVKSIADALPKLADYYEKNWPQWKRTRGGQLDYRSGYTMFTEFIKWSFYGVFTVKQQEDGRWVAARCTEKLLRDGEQATFATAEVARFVVDRHERDGVANYPALDDGYSWEIYPRLPGGCQTNGDKVSAL
jgi:hypothetical protein